MRLLTRNSSVTVLVTFAIPLCECHRGQVDPPGADFSGVYRISDARQGIFCAPQLLPERLSADSTLYVPIPPHRFSVSSLVQVVQSKNRLSIFPLDQVGHPMPALMLSGTIDTPTGAGTVLRSALPRTEGARVGGHTFYVADTSVASERFNLLLSTPVRSGATKAVASQAAVLTQNSETITFRDGGASGRLFTTCVVSDTLAGVRSGS